IRPDPVQARLLPLRPGLPGLRRGGGLPLPGALGAARIRRRRLSRGLRPVHPGRAPRLRGHPGLRPGLCLEEEGAGMGMTPETPVGGGRVPLPGGVPPGGVHQAGMTNAVDWVVGWARANSLWPLVFGTSCCAIEMMATGASHNDWARFGMEVARASPRQADLIILAGTIVEKMGSRLITLYEQMPGPKYVIAMGACTISGGPFYYDSYSVVKGADRLIPVDVYVPGCPPRPEALLFGVLKLQEL